MARHFKDGVKVDGVKIETIELMLFLNTFFVRVLSKDFIVTSCTDGKHMKNSKHYIGYAIDIRTRHLTPRDIITLVSWFKMYHDDEYDMVVEKDHIHVEYDPH